MVDHDHLGLPLRAPSPADANPIAQDQQDRVGALTEEASPQAGTSVWNRVPMYGDFFGLQEPPFDLTPDPRFLFLTPRQREALSNLRYGLTTSKGFTLLLGDAGTGKTTLVRAALAELTETPSKYVLLSNPTLGRGEFVEFLAREFNLSPKSRSSKTRFLMELRRDVEARFAAGGLTGLIIDEAQSMPYELLEEIRLLGNIETQTTKLLNIVLSGQPELAARLNEPSLRQLKQRVALRCELRPLSLDETAAYISGRLRIAGGLPQAVFTRQTVVAIHNASKGIPRTINVLCDNALVNGFAAGVKPITLDIVADVCRDFDLLNADEAGTHGSSTPEHAAADAAAPAAETAPAINGSAGSGLAPAVPKRKRLFSFFS